MNPPWRRACYQLPASGFRLPASGFRLSAFGYQLPASGYRLPATSSAAVKRHVVDVPPGADLIVRGGNRTAPVVPRTDDGNSEFGPAYGFIRHGARHWNQPSVPLAHGR